MRSKLAILAVAAAAFTMATFAAQAAPIAPIAGAKQASDQVIHVANGCGRYRHRNRWGRCVRNW